MSAFVAYNPLWTISNSQAVPLSAAHHDHHQHHDHRGNRGWALGIALAINGVYAVVEGIGGWYTGSLALLADAGHMVTDVAALGLSLFAVWFSTRPADPKRTFGYLRVETLAALANAAALMVLCGYIVVESVIRLGAPAEISSGPMLAIAIGGLIVNGVSAAMLHGGHQHDLNMRGAFLHLMADALGSVAAILAAVLIGMYGWKLADPIAAIVISLLVIAGTWRLLGDAVHVLMQGTPARLNIAEVEAAIRRSPDVCDVHDLHIWTLGAGREVLTAHVVLAPQAAAERGQTLLVELNRRLHDDFGIHHATIQLEYEPLAACAEPGSPYAHPTADAGEQQPQHGGQQIG